MNGINPVGSSSFYTQGIQQKQIVSDETLDAILRMAAMPSDPLMQKLLQNVTLASEAVGRSIDRLA